MQKITVPIIRYPHGEDLALPFYATSGSVGLDLCAALQEPYTLLPGQRFLVPTGFAIALPKGYEGQVRGRSGLAVQHGISVLNSPGTIDWDYRGELKVILIHHGEEPFRIERGLRIAQLIIASVQQIEWEEADTLTKIKDSNERVGGFGSTGL